MTALRGIYAHFAVVGVAMAPLAPVAAQVAPSSGVLQVTARIESGCRVSGQDSQWQDIDFGVLDFGTHPSIVVTELTAQSQVGMGMVQLRCIGVTSVNVSVGIGANASGEQRQLASGADRLAYDLFADPQFSLPFVGPAARTLPIAADGGAATVSLPIYGRIHAPEGQYAAGHYSDNVQITVSW